MRQRFEEILHTLTASTKEKTEKREWLMKLKKGVAKAKIDRANKILRKHLGNTNIFVQQQMQFMLWAEKIKERKGEGEAE